MCKLIETHTHIRQSIFIALLFHCSVWARTHSPSYSPHTRCTHWLFEAHPNRICALHFVYGCVCVSFGNAQEMRHTCASAWKTLPNINVYVMESPSAKEWREKSHSMDWEWQRRRQRWRKMTKSTLGCDALLISDMYGSYCLLFISFLCVCVRAQYKRNENKWMARSECDGWIRVVAIWCDGQHSGASLRCRNIRSEYKRNQFKEWPKNGKSSPFTRHDRCISLLCFEVRARLRCDNISDEIESSTDIVHCHSTSSSAAARGRTHYAMVDANGTMISIKPSTGDEIASRRKWKKKNLPKKNKMWNFSNPKRRHCARCLSDVVTASSSRPTSAPCEGHQNQREFVLSISLIRLSWRERVVHVVLLRSQLPWSCVRMFSAFCGWELLLRAGSANACGGPLPLHKSCQTQQCAQYIYSGYNLSIEKKKIRQSLAARTL